MADFVPFSPPLIGEEEIEEVVDTLRSTWITTGPKTKRFEGDFAEYLGAPGALALNSCTAGLHTSLITLGIGPSDEVISTPLTFASSINVIEHVGARPVLADVEPDTLCINPEAIAAAVTPRTRAIIPVHLAGHPADLDPIREIARQNSLTVIEDAAHCLPGKYKGRMIGSEGNPTSFSFYATKNITTAEGGMLTAEPEFLDRARVVSLHGMNRDAWKRYDKGGSWYYEIVQPGYKYNMTDIQAAMGIWQLKKLNGFQARRREVVNRYHAAFADCPAIQIPVERPEVEHTWHLYCIRIVSEALSIDRARFIDELTERQIGSSVHFIPIHIHPFYRDKYGYKPYDFPVAFSDYERLISIPLNPRISDEEVARVIDAVLDIVQIHRR